MRRFTDHAQQRLKERFPNLRQSDRKELVSNALEHGKCAMQFYDSNPALCNYLLKKGNRCNVRLYGGIVFVFNKPNNKLVTAYTLPEKIF